MPVPKEPFSQRFRARPNAPVRTPDDVPVSAKVRLVRVIDQRRNSSALPGAYSLAGILQSAVGRPSSGAGDMNVIRDFVQSLEWWEFYDVCEELVRVSPQPESVAADVDAVFSQEGLPYRIDAEGIHWRLSEPAEAAQAEANRLLIDGDDLRGPAEQWAKAQGHLASRPPDPENCIKDAVGALEGVARVIARKPSDMLGQILNSLAPRLKIHPTVKNAMNSLHAFRGDQPGVAHGAVASLDDLVLEAELILHWTASAIVYLVKKANSEK